MIDLVSSFMSLYNTLTAWCLRDDLDHRSNHYLIGSSFSFSHHVSSYVPKPLWRKADKAALLLKARELYLLSIHCESCKDIDEGDDRLVRS